MLNILYKSEDCSTSHSHHTIEQSSMSNSSEALNIFYKIFEVVDEWDEDVNSDNKPKIANNEEKSGSKSDITQVVWSKGDFTPKTTRLRRVPDALKRVVYYNIYNDLKTIPLNFDK